MRNISSSWEHYTTNDQHSSLSCKNIAIWTFAHHGVKDSDFCCFKCVTYVSL